uniref:Uncharacterized protein n=1 Tax=Rhizophora mucronata TaxID=61149 RepID=A0A2P2IX65_RHIMU
MFVYGLNLVDQKKRKGMIFFFFLWYQIQSGS